MKKKTETPKLKFVFNRETPLCSPAEIKPTLSVHPLAERFPDIPPEQFEELKQSIKENGLHEPIVVNDENQILDGRNRYRVCQQLGIEPRTVNWRDKLGHDHEKLTEAKFVFDANCHRRHLTADQRVALAAEFIPLFREIAKASQEVARQKKSKSGLVQMDQTKSTRGQLATAAKVSLRKAREVVKLHEDAPELIAEVFSGKKKLADAVRDLEGSKPKLVRLAEG